MKDHRSQKVKEICTANFQDHCRTTCPLSKACDTRAGDTKESFDKRMNKAAEELK
jgi:hypothetical protein